MPTTPSGILLSTTWNGSEATLLAEDKTFDPTLGWAFHSEWIGTRGAIDDMEADAINAGQRFSRSYRDDQHTISITSPESSTGAEAAVDSYEISTEYETREIWSNPNIVSLAYKSLAADIAAVLSKYKQFCNSRLRDLYPLDQGYVTLAEEIDWIKAGTVGDYIVRGLGPTPYDKLFLSGAEALADFGFADTNGQKRLDALNGIYFQMLMGMENWEVRRVTLSRRRTCSPKFAHRYVVDGVEKVYTTNQLIATAWSTDGLTIPGDVIVRLPQNPSQIPPNCVWGWKIRRQDSQQARGGKVEEIIDWVFAAWSRSLYQIVS